MPKMTFEFQQNKMMLHIRGNKAKNPPELFTIKRVDEASKTITLEFQKGKSENPAIIIGNQLTLNWRTETLILNRINKETFASRHTPPAPKVKDVTETLINAGLATGKVHGVDFKVEKAIIQNGNLVLRQGKEFFADQEINITTFMGPGKSLDGKRFTVKPDSKSGNPHVSMKYKVEGSTFPKTESFFKGYTMNLEFGTVSDGVMPGKIHLRLPDDAKSFVVGAFEAEVK